jgi:hypothetical protein
MGYAPLKKSELRSSRPKRQIALASIFLTQTIFWVLFMGNIVKPGFSI